MPNYEIRRSNLTIARPGSATFKIGMLLGLAAACPLLAGAQATNAGQLRIESFEIEGNRSIESSVIFSSIVTSPRGGWFIFRGDPTYFDEVEFQRDVLRIKLLYQQNGFLEATVDTVLSRDSSSVDIKVTIEEGRPVVVTRVGIQGMEGILDSAATIKRLPLREGDRFDRFRMQASADTLLLLIRNRGYPHARVFRSFETFAERYAAEVEFAIAPGARARFGPSVVRGNDKVATAVIRRMLAYRPDQFFSDRQVVESQTALYGLNVFDYVNVAADSSVARGDTVIPMVVTVSEGTFHNVRAGLGYGTVDCIRTSSGYTINNFLGGGRTLDLSARFSKIGAGSPFDWGLHEWPASGSLCGTMRDEPQDRRDLNFNLALNLTFPYLLSRKNRVTVGVGGERRSEIGAFLRREASTTVSLTRHFTTSIPVTLGYRLAYGSTIADAVVFCTELNVCREGDRDVFLENRISSVVTLAASENRIPGPNPRFGRQLFGEMRYAAGFLGSDERVRFARVFAEAKAFYPIGRRGAFGWRVSAGTILSPSFSFSGQTTSNVPVEERFYAGGPNSVRGFPQNELGPVVRLIETEMVQAGDSMQAVSDTTVSATGGTSIVVANVELRIPLPVFGGRVGIGLFADAGQVFERSDSGDLFGVSGLRVTPGVGIRFATPIGPVRLDAAYNGYDGQEGPIYRTEGEDIVLAQPDPYGDPKPEDFFSRIRFNFAVGHAF